MNFLIPRAKLSAFLITLSLVIGVSSVTGTAAIRIGSLVDVTGGTSDAGRDYAFGIGEAIHYINDNGGINGKKVKLYQFDYGYRQRVHGRPKIPLDSHGILDQSHSD